VNARRASLEEGAAGAGVPTAALEALQFGWGEAYEIGADDAGYWARRRDGLGGTMTADDPEKLREQVIADYSVKPVPRDADPAEKP